MNIDELTAWAEPIAEAIARGSSCDACEAKWEGNELLHFEGCSYLVAVDIIDEHDRNEDARMARGD
jgi:hypothetical protein